MWRRQSTGNLTGFQTTAMASYKALIFLFVALFAVAFATEEARGKRGVFYGGYGAVPYSAGYAGYSAYPYSAGYGLGYSGYAAYPHSYAGYGGYSAYPGYGAVSYVH